MDRTMLPYYGVRLLFSLAQLGLVLYLFRYVAVRVGLVDAYRRHAAARFLMLIPCAFAVVFAAGAALQLAVAFGAGHPELMRQNMGAVFNVVAPTFASDDGLGVWYFVPVAAAVLVGTVSPANMWALWVAGLCVLNALLFGRLPLMYAGVASAVFDSVALLYVGRKFPMRCAPAAQRAVAGAGAGTVASVSGVPEVPRSVVNGFSKKSAEDVLKSIVVGQDEAVDALVKRLSINLRKRAGNPGSVKPLSVFMFVGPTGVGKTETAKALAEYVRVLDERYSLLTFDMSEFYDRATVANFVGSPRGYIGSDEPGRLTGAMQKNPYRVVLFDEIEKADPSVMNVFLQIFDEGRLTDSSSGFRAHFNASVVVLTSNLANEEIGEIIRRTKNPVTRELRVKDILKHSGIRPEILARVDEVISYRALEVEDYVNIVANHLDCLLSTNPGLRPRVGNLVAAAEGIVEKYRALMPYGVREILRKAEEEFYALADD